MISELWGVTEVWAFLVFPLESSQRQNASDNDRQKDQPTNHRKQNDPPDDVCLARVSTLRRCMPKGALDALRVFCCSAVFNYFHTDTLAFDQNTAVAGARKARRCGAFRAPVKCLTARDTLMHREEVPRETRAAPVLAADVTSAHDNLVLVVALPVDRHEVRGAACLARLPVQARRAPRVARDARLLVPVVPRVADAAPSIRRVGAALPGKCLVVVTCVVR